MMIVYNRTNIDEIWMMNEEYIRGLYSVTGDFGEKQILRGAVYLSIYKE